MELTILLTADFANIDAAGKLNVIGSFNSIRTEGVPVMHQLMHLVVRLSATLGEVTKQSNLKIILWDADGNTEWETPNLPFEIKSLIPGIRGEHTSIIGLGGLVFNKLGAYSFNVYVDDEFKGSAPLDVIQIR